MFFLAVHRYIHVYINVWVWWVHGGVWGWEAGGGGYVGVGQNEFSTNLYSAKQNYSANSFPIQPQNYIISRTIPFSLSLSYSTVNIYICAVHVLLKFSL